MEKIDTRTPDITEENIEKIIELFPQVATEVEDENGKIKRAVDFDALRDLLGDVAEGQRERYQFTWPGKREAKAEARRPIDKTMIPCPEKSVDWDTTENLYIEGDNLDALKILKETYAGKVNLVYADPPYNTGHDLIYDDDYSIAISNYDCGENSELGRLVTNQESSGRFHSDWCSMIYPRLLLIRDLLSSIGIAFFSIGDDELSNMEKICNEVFGATNHIATCTRIAKRTSNKGNYFKPTKDYILVFAKDVNSINWKFGVINNVDIKDYKYEDEKGKYKKNGASLYQPSLDSRPNQRYYIECPDGTFIIPPGNVFPDEIKDGAKIKPLSNSDKCWRWSQETYLANKDKLMFTPASSSCPLIDSDGNPSNWNIYDKVYLSDKLGETLLPEDVIYDYVNSQGTKEVLSLGLDFSFAKPVGLIQHLIRLTLLPKDSIVLDPFAGSSTTAQSVMQMNVEDGGLRRFVLIQYPEAIEDTDSELYITDLGEERIRRAGKKIIDDVANENMQLKIGEEPKLLPDIGFRVLRIDSSNFRDTYATPDQLDQASLLDSIDNIKDGRTAEDILFQVLPAFRIPYSAHIETLDINGKQVFDVNHGQLLACFDIDITNDVIEEIARRKPSYAVMRDLSFKNDSAAANFEELFKTYSPDTIRRVI